MNGKLLWFNPAKHHGFIATEEGERLLVEESGFEPGQLPGERCAGVPVTFERLQAADLPARAINVCTPGGANSPMRRSSTRSTERSSCGNIARSPTPSDVLSDMSENPSNASPMS